MQPKLKLPPLPSKPVLPDDPYERVHQELQRGEYDQGLWLKTFSQNNGNQDQAQAAYIKARVDQIRTVQRANESTIKYTGVKGWLRFYCNIIIFTSYFQMLEGAGVIVAMPVWTSNLSAIDGLLLLVAGATAIGKGYSANIGGKFLLEGKPIGLIWNKRSLVLKMLYVFITYVLLARSLNKWLDPASGLVVWMIWPMIWWIYFRRSKRVYGTYSCNME